MKQLLRKLLPDPFDLLFFCGAAAIVFGVYRIYAPLAWVVGGVIAIRASWLASAGRRHLEK
jgi:hypothetical protein